MFGNTLSAEVFKIELQTSRQHRDRQFLRIRGGEQKLYVRRRLFEGFQQRSKARLGEHMHFIDKIDLVATSRGRILNIVQQLAHIIYASARCSIHLNQIDKPPFADLSTGGTLTAGNRTDTGFTVEAFREDPSNSGFTHSPGPGKQIGMVQSIVIESIDQRLQHMLLTSHFGENTRAPFAGKYLVTHSSDGLVCKKAIIRR